MMMEKARTGQAQHAVSDVEHGIVAIIAAAIEKTIDAAGECHQEGFNIIAKPRSESSWKPSMKPPRRAAGPDAS
jgi:hypothetical protein